ncbi:MAG: MarR family transcriptional regulator [Planctomycetes bacterium]|nr:MarR family transcriptional regulator [Planctomycetota bacterium]
MVEELSMARMRILWLLDFLGPTGPCRIARVLGVSAATASGLVDELVRAGLVHRERSSQDRREVDLTLRAKGRRMIARFALRRREKFRRLLSVVGRDDARRLASALATVDDVLAKGLR